MAVPASLVPAGRAGGWIRWWCTRSAPRRPPIGEFPGFADCTVSKAHLDLIVKQRIESWRALSGVAGIYVIAERTTGKLYVGSASGDGDIWQRWCSYSETGHGGNAKLRALLAEKGDDYAVHFQFGVLEIAGTHGDDLIDSEPTGRRCCSRASSDTRTTDPRAGRRIPYSIGHRAAAHRSRGERSGLGIHAAAGLPV